jgi:predicted metalloprotease with PDZ domain
MRRLLLLFLLALLLASIASAQPAPVSYQVRYRAAGDPLVQVSLILAAPAIGPLHFVMPRAIPGGYAQQEYDRYVRDLKAFGDDRTEVAVTREDGPRWLLGHAGQRVVRVEYAVDVAQMEREIFDASDTSKQRDGYVGLLGYSIFGYIESMEDRPVRLDVDAPDGWPVFLTLAPRVPPATGRASAQAASFYALADAQVVLGPDVVFRRVAGEGLPLYLAIYAEAREDVELEGSLARAALDRVAGYFGNPPFTHYTVHLELLKPISPRHGYGFSMEHLESGTFFMGIDRALTADSPRSARGINLFNYAHHMAHSWIPKHAYGEQYFPHSWEIAPIIDTVWFNEGFGRYAAIDALASGMPTAEADAFRARHLERLRAIVEGAPRTIRRMPLVDLSRVASVLYSRDFRTGMNTFARGALMAAEMDARIRERSGGARRLRDALRFMPEWVRRTGRGFRTSEFAGIIREASGVEVADILDRWLAARHE